MKIFILKVCEKRFDAERQEWSLYNVLLRGKKEFELVLTGEMLIELAKSLKGVDVAEPNDAVGCEYLGNMKEFDTYVSLLSTRVKGKLMQFKLPSKNIEPRAILVHQCYLKGRNLKKVVLKDRRLESFYNLIANGLVDEYFVSEFPDVDRAVNDLVERVWKHKK